MLLDSNKLCFNRDDLVRGKCNQIRKGEDIAQEYLRQEYERDIVILRILDREKEKFKLPKPYSLNKNISVINIVTRPEIEILHILSEGLKEDFERNKRHKKNLKPSEFCQGYFSTRNKGRIRSVKSAEFVNFMYGEHIDKLIDAIEQYHRNEQQEAYSLWDLLV